MLCRPLQAVVKSRSRLSCCVETWSFLVRLCRNPTGDFSAPALSTLLHNDKWLKRKLSNLQTACFFYSSSSLSSRGEGRTPSHKTESFIACSSGDASFPFHPGPVSDLGRALIESSSPPPLISCDRRCHGSGCPLKLN